jgi:hypothetical protein
MILNKFLIKKYKVGYKDKHYPLEGMRYVTIKAPNKRYIRDNFAGIMDGDIYKIHTIEEVK